MTAARPAVLELAAELLGRRCPRTERRRHAREIRHPAAPLDRKQRQDRRRPGLGRQQLRDREARLERLRLGPGAQPLDDRLARLLEPHLRERPAARLHDRREPFLELGGSQQATGTKRVDRDGRVDGRRHDRRRIATLEQLEPLLVEPSRWGGIEHGRAAERRLAPQDDAVAARRDDGSLEPQLRRLRADPGDAGRDPRGAVVHRDAGAAVDRHELLELDIEAVGDRKGAGRHERVAAVQVAPVDAGKTERNPLAGARPLDSGVVHLHGANAHLAAARSDLEHVALGDRARPERAGDDGADAAEREHPVDVEPCRPGGVAHRRAVGHARERSSQIVEAQSRSWR